MHPSTLAIHADDELHLTPSVTCPIETAVTFRYEQPEDEAQGQTAYPFDPLKDSFHKYSRITNPGISRAEAVISQLCNGKALCAASGLGAGFLALMHVSPTAVSIRGGYFGCHTTIQAFQRIKKDCPMIDLDDDYPEGTLCWLETPVNPVGEARDIQYYADKVHKAGGKLMVDATFAPPPLQDPFKHGADIVMHSGTKYFVGHSDALSGILVVKSDEEWSDLWRLRTATGIVGGALENWLLLRSMRTMELRVTRQAETGTQLAQWLDTVIQQSTASGKEHDGFPPGVIASVSHASVQAARGGFDAFKAGQLKNGPACFAIMMTDAHLATHFPHTLKLFAPATSLGGVESLVQHGLYTDSVADPKLVRLSVGLEHLDDLKDDIRAACKMLLEKRAKQ